MGGMHLPASVKSGGMKISGMYLPASVNKRKDEDKRDVPSGICKQAEE